MTYKLIRESLQHPDAYPMYIGGIQSLEQARTLLQAWLELNGVKGKVPRETGREHGVRGERDLYYIEEEK